MEKGEKTVSFQAALSNVLLTLLYILPGFLLGMRRKETAGQLPALSAALIYICSPCLPVSAFLKLDFSWPAFGMLWLFFLVTLLLQSAFMAILFLLFRRRYHDARYRVLNIASVLGNVGFFGIPIMQALMPESPEVAGYAAMYIVSMNILVFTMGIYCLTKERRYMSLRAALLNPSMLGFAVALPLYMTEKSSFFQRSGRCGAKLSISPSLLSPPNPYTIFAHAMAMLVTCRPSLVLRL